MNLIQKTIFVGCEFLDSLSYFPLCIVNVFLYLCDIPAMFDIAKSEHFLALKAVPERQLITRGFW